MTSGPNPHVDTPEDLLDDSYWRPLRLLEEAIVEEIASLYSEAGIEGVRGRYVGPLLQLARHEPMTIGELATRVEVTHSAMSQTVAAMRRAGLVESANDGGDGRERRVRLSAQAAASIRFLRAEWRATEATLRELDREIPYSLIRAVADMTAALHRRSFRERLRQNLDLALAGRLRES